MARLVFVDENNKQGEIDLGKVRVGDLVRFRADFFKTGDDTEQKVMGGEIGEVLEVYPQMPGLLIEAPCQTTAPGGSLSGDAELVVTPDDVMLVVDARDPRLSSTRTMVEASIDPEELDVFLRALKLRVDLRGHRRVVAAELVLAGLRRAARFVAMQSDDAWRDYVHGAGLVKEAAWSMTWHDWPWLVIWAMDANKANYPGQGSFSIMNRRHVLWALEQNAKRLKQSVPKHQIDWTDEDEIVAELADESEQLANFIRRSDDAGWHKALDDFEDIAKQSEDPMLHSELTRWTDPAPEPQLVESPSGDFEFVEAPPAQPERDPSLPPKPIEVGMDDVEQWQQHLKNVEEERRRRDERIDQQIQNFNQQQQRVTPKKPPAVPAERPAPTPSAEPEEIMLEPPGGGPQKVLPSGPAPEMALPPPRTPFPSTPSKYDAPPFGGEERGPHEWATPPSAQARIPISVYPGYEKGKSPRSTKVWAEPEMLVENRKTQETGAIVGFKPDDKVLVDVHDPSTRLPVGEVPAEWDAIDVRLSPEWQFPVEKLTPEEMATWRSTRHTVQKQQLRDQKKQSDLTIVTAEELFSGQAREADTGSDRDHRGRLEEGGSRAGTPDSGVRRDPRARESGGGGDVVPDGWCAARYLLVNDEHGEAGHRVATAPLGINELKRFLAGPTPFGVVSAYKERSKHENQKAHGQLMRELQRRGYSPGQIRPLTGQYFGAGGEMKAEKSYLVLGMSFEDAQELGEMFEQQSVIWKSEDGVVGAYYTDGSGRVNYALTPEGDLAIGEEAAPRVEQRKPKPEHMGPPAKEDPWSKARNVGFEFSIDWGKTFPYDPKAGPPPAEEARQRVTELAKPTVVSTEDVIAA